MRSEINTDIVSMHEEQFNSNEINAYKNDRQTNLDFSSVDFKSDEGIQEMKKLIGILRYSDNAKTLTVSKSQFSKSQLIQLFRGLLKSPHLIELNLSHCELANHNVNSELADMMKKSQLRALNLYNNGFSTEQSFIEIITVGLFKNKTISELDYLRNSKRFTSYTGTVYLEAALGNDKIEEIQAHLDSNKSIFEVRIEQSMVIR